MGWPDSPVARFHTAGPPVVVWALMCELLFQVISGLPHYDRITTLLKREQVMSINELGWILGVHLVMSVWLGLLAGAWKGRDTRAWFLIGLLTSVFGLLALARLPRLPRLQPGSERDMQMQHLDTTRLTN